MEAAEGLPRLGPEFATVVVAVVVINQIVGPVLCSVGLRHALAREAEAPPRRTPTEHPRAGHLYFELFDQTRGTPPGRAHTFHHPDTFAESTYNFQRSGLGAVVEIPALN